MESQRDAEDDVMVQGASYEEEGVSEADDKGTKFKRCITPNPEAKGGSDKRKLMILGGVVVTVLLLVISIGGGAIALKNDKYDDEYFEEEETIAFKYTLDEIEALRLAGYTGDEIEAYEYAEQDVDYLVEDAERKRKEQYEKEIAPYFDEASDKFKSLYEDTWVGQPELVFDTNTEEYGYYKETMNVDYEKLPARGNQLFIKFTLPNSDKVAFTTIDPERWLTLNDAGNIVLSVSFTETSDGKRIITSISEVTP